MNDNFKIDTLPIAEEIKINFEKIIDLLGEDTDREGLKKTVCSVLTFGCFSESLA